MTANHASGNPHTPSMTHVSQRGRRPVRYLLLLLIVAVIGGAVFIYATRGPSDAANAKTASPAGTGSLAPNGTFTAITGKATTIASLRGSPAMVWFVAGGCASCAASIPAVTEHLSTLHADGVRVVTLGLWGAFPSGPSGLTELAAFGHAAGGNLGSPGWTWGMASKRLSLSYDPSGTPDEYVLINSSGHIVYRNSVPVSTMGALLLAANEVHRE